MCPSVTLTQAELASSPGGSIPNTVPTMPTPHLSGTHLAQSLFSPGWDQRLCISQGRPGMRFLFPQEVCPAHPRVSWMQTFPCPSPFSSSLLTSAPYLTRHTQPLLFPCVLSPGRPGRLTVCLMLQCFSSGPRAVPPRPLGDFQVPTHLALACGSWSLSSGGFPQLTPKVTLKE